ncbi:hypothetical protein CRYUN_Cryun20dG0039000 [Craigia yunnanensis]
MLNGGEYTQEMAEPFSSMTEVTTTKKKKNKNKNKNKRRFSDEQIKSLELMFESESRLEPPKKLQVARELGLQPRQVAIWFQNKRARWKSKQIEQDYCILQANYNNLASKFDSLYKENQALVIQLQKLNDLLKKPKEEGQCCGQGTAMNSNDAVSDKGEAVKSDSEGQLSISMERSEHALRVLSDDDSAIKTDYFGLEEEPNLISMVEPADGSLTSPEDWRSFDSDGLFNQSSSGYHCFAGMYHFWPGNRNIELEYTVYSEIMVRGSCGLFPYEALPLALASCSTALFSVQIQNAAFLLSFIFLSGLVASFLAWNAVNWKHHNKTAFAFFLNSFPDSDLRLAREGQLVKITGIASCGSLSLETSYERVARCIYASTLLYEYGQFGLKPVNVNRSFFHWNLAYGERFSTDFYITDQRSGIRAVVKAGSGCKVIPLIIESKLITTTKQCRNLSPHLSNWLRDRNLSAEARLLCLEEGYVQEGSTVAVTGMLHKSNDSIMIVQPPELISTGCLWRRLLLPVDVDGLILGVPDIDNPTLDLNSIQHQNSSV